MERLRVEAGYDSDDDFFDTKDELLHQAVRGIKRTDKGLKALINSPSKANEVHKPILSMLKDIEHIFSDDEDIKYASSNTKPTKHTPAPVAVTKPTYTTGAVYKPSRSRSHSQETIAIESITSTLPDDDYHNLNLNLNIKIPRLTRRDSWKFTWIGFILAAFVAWFVAESAVCQVHCRPTLSRKHDWIPGKPSFGLSLPYMLDDVTGQVVSRTWASVDRALGPRRDGSRNDWWDGRKEPVGVVGVVGWEDELVGVAPDQ
jgi:hypothetical protein